jgi:hypothetical protein
MACWFRGGGYALPCLGQRVLSLQQHASRPPALANTGDTPPAPWHLHYRQTYRPLAPAGLKVGTRFQQLLEEEGEGEEEVIGEGVDED